MWLARGSGSAGPWAKVPDPGEKYSVVVSATRGVPIISPPATSTFPPGMRLIVWLARASNIGLVSVHAFGVGGGA